MYLTDHMQTSWIITKLHTVEYQARHALHSLPSGEGFVGWQFRYHSSSWYVIFNFCAKFPLSSMIRSLSRNPHPRSDTWRTLKVPDWILGWWGHYCHDMWFLTCVPNFIYLAWIEVCQEPPGLKVILGGHWRFLTGYLKNEVILDIKNHHDKSFLTSWIMIWYSRVVYQISALY